MEATVTRSLCNMKLSIQPQCKNGIPQGLMAKGRNFGLRSTSRNKDISECIPLQNKSELRQKKFRVDAYTRESLLEMVPKHTIEELGIELPKYDTKKNTLVDLVVVGGGPAGLAVAQQVSASGLSVCCVDPSPNSVWPNNYGVWVDEFEAMGLSDCLDFIWPKAVVYLDEDKTKFLERPYGRVNRVRLKTKMITKCVENGVKFHKAKADSVTHEQSLSTVQCSDGTVIKSSVVLDATGFSKRLIKYSEPYNPGYQAAWGILAEVESHPFDLDKMLFMDWRDSHLRGIEPLKSQNEAIPTFLYAMPFSSTRVFLEETSLVGRPAVPFPEIQERMAARLEHLGIKVKKIEEEEYCLIPMGGNLPDLPQRVLGIGGTAGMVHPSTGYMVARTLGAAPEIAEAIVSKLLQKKLRQTVPASVVESTQNLVGVGKRASSPVTLLEKKEELVVEGAGGDDVSREIWAKIWPGERQEQREFFSFGMDVLLKLDLNGTRRFFDAFFDLSPYHWQGFLSSRLYLGELIKFGLALFAHASNYARVEIIGKGIPGLGTLITNVVKIKTK